MTLIAFNPEADRVNSTAAISALATRRLRMQTQRYQRGSLSLVKRKSKPDTWVYRYYAEDNGRRVYKKQIVGTVVEFPKRKDAEKAVAPLRVDVNDGAAFAPMNMDQLAAHYQVVELPSKAYSTQEGYKNYIAIHILPKWGKHSLSAVKSVEVEAWLRTLKTAKGKPASPGTRTKIRNLMSAIFSHAIRYEWAARNPITAVRTSSKRLRTPDILTPEEFQGLIQELPERARVIVLLAGTTGLRRGELIGLRWGDIDFDAAQADVMRSVWRNIEGDTKTEVSRRPVPLHPIVMEALKDWRKESLYSADADFVFPSIEKNGTQPISPETILRRQIRPTLKKLGITKQVGFHTFRHTLGTWLRQRGIDIKTAQELLRHANPRITMAIYQQAVSAERRDAQNRVVAGLIPAGVLQHPSAPSEGV
jgi:integrase